MSNQNYTRKEFIKSTSAALGGTLIGTSALAGIEKGAAKFNKRRLALVGTGIRGITFWGRRLQERYSDVLEFVGLCDINPGRLEYGKQFIGANCRTFTDFNEMMDSTNPDILIVSTIDANHHKFIINGLKRNIDVITEKPLTTDEFKCQAILDAEKESEGELIVGFNYRYSPHHTKIKELLLNDRIGKITSVDFNWYLNVYHGASYFRRWHGIEASSGTLLVHKSTHHFDLLNWWLDSDPVEVYAKGSLEHYGSNNSFRGNKCRGCPHQNNCEFYWDITQNDLFMDLYAANEHHDGYLRDNCLWRHEIDIYDKMSVQIKYANDVQVNYSLTTYSPYEGMQIAFNGFDGRIDAWHGIPWRESEKANQSELHAREMSQEAADQPTDFEEIMVMDNFSSDYEHLKVYQSAAGHGGGDERLQNRIFRNSDADDPYQHTAGLRDGAMSILIGIAARNSIESGRPVRIDELTTLQPHPNRMSS
jgi:predicted dehydrogenase